MLDVVNLLIDRITAPGNDSIEQTLTPLATVAAGSHPRHIGLSNVTHAQLVEGHQMAAFCRAQ